MTNMVNLTVFIKNLFHHILSSIIVPVFFCCMIVQAQTPPTNTTNSPATTHTQANPTSTLPNTASDISSPTSDIDSSSVNNPTPDLSPTTYTQTSPTSNLSNTTDTSSPTSDVNIDPSSVDTENSVVSDTAEAPIENDIQLESTESTDKSLDLQSYEYDPIGKKDPFLSLRVKEISTTASINDSTDVTGNLTLEPLLPLERFSIDQLKLMGIIWGGNEPRVLLMDPNNKSYVVKKNERIGRNKGYLAEIREGEVIIAEPHQYGSRIQYSIKTLTLQKNKKK